MSTLELIGEEKVTVLKCNSCVGAFLAVPCFSSNPEGFSSFFFLKKNLLVFSWKFIFFIFWLHGLS